MMTHYRQRVGHLIWMANSVFEEQPTIEGVRQVDRWRWPIFFPLGAAIRRKIVTPIGVRASSPCLASVARDEEWQQADRLEDGRVRG